MARVDALACGECGGTTFALRHVRKKSDPRVGGGAIGGRIRAVCLDCKAHSDIVVQPPALEITGTLCGGWANPPRGPGARPSAKGTRGKGGP